MLFQTAFLALVHCVAAAPVSLGGPPGPQPWSFSLVSSHGSQKPDARQGHAAVEVGRKIYIIGGCVQEIRCHNDVHVFDTGSNLWTEEKMSGELPEPRGGHTATLVGSDIFVFGGANSEETFGDVYRLDLVRRQWTRFVNSRDGLSPGKRTSHAAAADANGRIYTFGGYDADGNFLDDLWILHASPSPAAAQNGANLPLDIGAPMETTWAKPVPTGPVPTAREGHSLSLLDRKLLLFGGYTGAGKAINDVHVFDLESQQWSKLEISGEVPAPRQAHSAARHGHEVIVAGGCDVSEAKPQCFNDVWSLSLVDMRWTERSKDAPGWSAREGHTASFVGGRMFAFGGCQLNANCFGDVVVLDTLDPCPASCGNHGTCVDNSFCKCTEPGFTGHDCMQPLSCQMDCGQHGACSQEGQCVCLAGWSGDKCASPPRCPGSPLACSGRGECLPGGICRCQPGAGGDDCFADGVLSAFAGNSSKATVATVNPHAQQGVSLLMLGAGFAGDPNAAITQAPSTKDFGIPKVNTDGHIDGNGADSYCSDNCNWRGICDNSICYCQPGYFGQLCENQKVNSSGTLDIWTTLAVAGVALGGSFLITMIALLILYRKKRAKEREANYAV